MKKLWSLLVFSLVTSLAVAQESSGSEMVTDRPSRTQSASVIPRGYFQIETGVQYEEGIFPFFHANGSVSFNNTEVFTYNTSLFRYGLGDKVELRLIQNIGSVRFNEISTDTEFGPTLIGAKVRLFESRHSGPQVSVLGHIGGPVLSDSGAGTQADLRLSLQQNLSEKLVLSTNLGVLLEDDLNDASTLYTLMLGYQISQRFSTYVEVFGNSGDNTVERSQQNMDVGFAYSVNANFQIDTYFGTAVSDFGPDSIFGAGLSFRIPHGR